MSFFIVVGIGLTSLYGQEETTMTVQDTAIISSGQDRILLVKDTLSQAEIREYNKNVKVEIVKDFKPDPTKAVIYSAIFPGLGQIYNRKYWKLPIVYGGFMGVMYAVTWNGNMYTDYKNGYKDIMLNPRTMTRWHNLVSGNIDEITKDFSQLSWWRDHIKRNRDMYRRNRDLAIIVGVGLYALCMIDAYVDAHLYNFTVSPDLSMTMAPVLWGPSSMSNSVTVGLQCSIVF